MSLNQGKRSEIISAAIGLISENGFEKTSVSQIVQKAGVAQGTFYLYFKSKNELVPAIAQLVVDSLMGKINDFPEESFDTLRSLIDNLTEATYTVTGKNRDLITFCYSGMAYYQSFELWEQIYQPYYTWVEQKLAFLREKREIRKTGNIKYLANFTVGILEHGAENHYLFQDQEESLMQSKEEVKDFLYRALTK